MSSLLKPWRKKEPPSAELSRTQYSPVDRRDLAPARELFTRLDPRHDQNGCTSTVNLERVRHMDSDEELPAEQLDAEVRFLRPGEDIQMNELGRNGDIITTDSKTGSGVKKKESLWCRACRYTKLTFLVSCWALYSSVLMLHSEKVMVERHSSLAANEVKGYKISTSPDSLRVAVTLNGPFWRENAQRRENYSVVTRYLQVWLEREEDGDSNHSVNTMPKIEKSEPWLLYLLEDDQLDLSQGEIRTSTLEMYEPTSKVSKPYKYIIKMMHTVNTTVPFTLIYNDNPLDTKTGIVYAAFLLIVLYVIIIFDLINRTLAAIITSSSALAVLAVVGERPTMQEIVAWMDPETLLFLFSMMLIVGLMAETGVFDYLAVVAFERTRGETWPLINLLFLLNIVVSLFLDNFTTVLLLTPATIRLCEVTHLNPLPILMAMVVFSNVGGTATPVGDPPNIIIANNPAVLNDGINFTTFTLHMSVGVFLVFMQTYLQFRLMYRDARRLRADNLQHDIRLKQEISDLKRFSISLADSSAEEKQVKNVLEKKMALLEQKIKGDRHAKTALPPECFEQTLKEMKAKYKINNMTQLVQTLVAIGFVIVMFFLHSVPELCSLSLGWSALVGATLLLLLVQRTDLQPLLATLEWSTLLFFAALFVLMEAVTKLGLIQWIGGITEQLILQVDKSMQLPVALLLVIWVTGLTSAFVDNIPLTSMMVRVVASLGSNPALDLPMAPLIWALSFGACLGGNGTLVGASANVIAAGIAEQHNYRITFKEFFKFGAPMTVMHLIVVSAYLLVAHCVFTWH